MLWILAFLRIENREKGLNAGQDREFTSWQNSMQFMRNIVDDSEIDDEVQIAIEYNIPQTSKRVDFIIIGADSKDRENIVIVELKQWSKAEVVDDDMHFSVRTYVANDKRIVCHPSYQAYSYSRFLANYSQSIHDRNIQLIPCAYLHNYLPAYKSALSADIYKEWYTTAPFFIMACPPGPTPTRPQVPYSFPPRASVTAHPLPILLHTATTGLPRPKIATPLVHTAFTSIMEALTPLIPNTAPTAMLSAW